MQWYFSGCNSAKDVQLLQSAGATHILVDPFSLDKAQSFAGRVALDSGAYAVFKQRRQMHITEYLRIADSRDFDFRLSLDVIGDAKKGMRTGGRCKRLAASFRSGTWAQTRDI